MATHDLIEALGLLQVADPGGGDQIKPVIALPHSRGKFKLFGLPRELRDLIYEYATTSKERISLFELTIPEFILANDAIRAEALPIFFASNTFNVDVVTNVDASKMEDLVGMREELTNRDLLDQDDYDTIKYLTKELDSMRHQVLKCGSIRLDHETERWLIGQGPEMVTFRNINFRITLHGYGFWGNMELALPLYAPSDLDPRPDDASEDCPDDTAVRFYGSDYGRISAQVCDTMTNIFKRPGYKGLTLEDLRAVAQGFRYWPDWFSEAFDDPEEIKKGRQF